MKKPLLSQYTCRIFAFSLGTCLGVHILFLLISVYSDEFRCIVNH
jgi:hypothetical protein